MYIDHRFLGHGPQADDLCPHVTTGDYLSLACPSNVICAPHPCEGTTGYFWVVGFFANGGLRTECGIGARPLDRGTGSASHDFDRPSVDISRSSPERLSLKVLLLDKFDSAERCLRVRGRIA